MEDSGGVTALTEAEVATLDSFPEGCACTSVSLKPDMPTKQSESNESCRSGTACVRRVPHWDFILR